VLELPPQQSHRFERLAATLRVAVETLWDWLGIPDVQQRLGSAALLLCSLTFSLWYFDVLVPGHPAAAADADLFSAALTNAEAAAIFEAPDPSARGLRHVGRLGAGETLAKVLKEHGASNALIHQIDRGMRHLIDFRRAQPGHRYQLELDRQGGFAGFVYEVSALERYRFEAVPGAEKEYRAFRLDARVTRRLSRMAGVVSTSLYEAVQDLGEVSQVASDFAAIFAWDLDFSRSVRAGDEFRVLYERNYVSEGEREIYLGPGRILAASYSGAAGDLHAVYFESREGRGSYYRPDGRSVQRRFLVAPLNYSRISSTYSARRFHPILKVNRPHRGIDYAAPSGTPVWAVADGEVIHKGRAGASGRMVKIRHYNGYVSSYAHLSRFATGLTIGQAVFQKQRIGYVGQSGLATGPHVCFRVQRNGRYVNPTSIDAPTAEPISESDWTAFAAARDARLARLGRFPLVTTDEAL
jgi:murein DD-endopeptidase MepM/ murein hydrolase activator NlpD